MRTLKTSEAAALLRVSSNTLRTWEERFGYPIPQRSPGRHRMYLYAEIDALRHALEEGLSISSAVSAAQDAVGTDANALYVALLSLRTDRADAAMESMLQLRTVERSVEEVLLPAVEHVRRRTGATSASWCFSARWARDWMRRAQRLTPERFSRAAIVVGDASAGELDPVAPQLRAFELFCERTGVAVMSLPVTVLQGLDAVAARVSPWAIVIAGSTAGDEEVARWAYQLRCHVGPVRVVLYHRSAASQARRPLVLPPSPGGARDELLRLEERAHRGPFANGRTQTPEWQAP
jgi:DNA-binding transcriptional MerR regulator